MWQRMYIDDESWEEITEGTVRYKLDTVYNDVDNIMRDAKATGTILKTPLCFYRFVLTIE